MAEAGLLPPGLLAALRQAGHLPPAPVGRASLPPAWASLSRQSAAGALPMSLPRPSVSPQAAQQIQQAGSVEEAIQTARTVLGISKQVMNDESLLRQIVDPIWTEPPPVSFGGATTSEAQAAFEAQRAGERAPFAPDPVVAGAELAAENALRAAQGAPPFTETFQDPRFPGMEFPTPGPVEGIPTTPLPQVPAEVAQGADIAMGGPATLGVTGLDTLTALGWTADSINAVGGVEAALAASGPAIEAGVELAPVAAEIPGVLADISATLKDFAPALTAAGAMVGLASGAYKIAQGQLAAGVPSTAGSVISLAMLAIPGLQPFAWIPAVLGGAGGFLGGLFDKPDVPHEVREARELGRHAQQAGAFVGEIGSAQDFDALYNTLLAHQTGYVGGTSPQAVNISVRGLPDYLGLYQTDKPVSQQQFFEEVRRRPQDLYATVQAGVTPASLDPLNIGITRSVQSKLSELDFRAKAAPVLQSINQARSADQQFTSDDLLDAAKLARDRGIALNSSALVGLLEEARKARPAPVPGPVPTPEPAPSPELPPPEPPPDLMQWGGSLQSIHGGGLIPRTGPYQLQGGELVIPRPIVKRLMEKRPSTPDYQRGGRVPARGVYGLHRDELLVPDMLRYFGRIKKPYPTPQYESGGGGMDPPPAYDFGRLTFDDSLGLFRDPVTGWTGQWPGQLDVVMGLSPEPLGREEAIIPPPTELAPLSVPSMQTGGRVPQTDQYLLHQGEEVIPRDVADALRRGQIQPEEAFEEPRYEQRIAGIPGREPLSREALAKRGVGLLEERTILPPERWYVHSREGAPFQAKANSDPANIWRLATDARQVREALDEGDPVIAVPPDVLRMPIHRAAPLIERARVAQYEQAGGGIELLDAMARTRGGMAQPAPDAGFMRAAETAFAAQGRER